MNISIHLKRNQMKWQGEMWQRMHQRILLTFVDIYQFYLKFPYIWIRTLSYYWGRGYNRRHCRRFKFAVIPYFSVRHSSFRNIDFCRMQQNSIWLTFGIMVGGSFGFEMVRIIKWSPNSFLYRKPLNFSTFFSHTVSQSYRIPDLIKSAALKATKKTVSW